MADDKSKYNDVIRQLIPINELAQDLQTQAINSASLLQVKKKGFIFKQGDRDNFSYYLLEGEIEMLANDQPQNSIVAGTDRARYAMAQLQPRQFSGRAKTESAILQITRDSLDRLMILQQEKTQVEDSFSNDMSVSEMEVAELSEDEDVDWMTRLLQSDLFAKMPTANIHQLFAMLESIEYSTGDVVVRQGESGEDFYIIQEGRCEVTRKPPSGGKELKLAELRAGDSFGEEALLTESNRNATVSMVTDGTLMRLSKESFIELIKNPALHTVTYAEAMEKIGSGQAKWLDVRYKNEHDKSAIEGSLHVPLNILRMQMEKMDQGTYYIVYCDTGGRSSTAAFLLAARGFDVSYLRGGLVNNPDAADPAERTVVPVAAKPKEDPKPEAKPEVKKKPEPVPTKPEKVEDNSDDDVDPEIQASYLETELSRTNLQLEAAKKQTQTQDADLEKMREEAQRKLEEEREKLQIAKKAAEEQAKGIRAQEEEKLKKLEAEAKRRIEEEKKKLEEVYSRNAEEMEKLEKMKQEAEEQAKQGRENLAKQAEEAKRNQGEAAKLRKELEASKLAMAQEAEKRKKEQEEMERRIQMKARQKLAEERKKMAEQYARNNQELEQARRERAAAEAARVAAKQEADKVISEYKSQHDKDRSEEEAKLKAERLKLEEEQRKIQETLKEIQQTRAEAEALKQAAMSEVAALKEKQKEDEITENKVAQDSLKNEIKQAEAKLNKAKLNIAQSQQQTVKVQEAKRVNAADIEAKRKEEEELHKQLEADLAGFKEELEEQEREYANATTQLEHMRRIKERAEAAKKAAEDANEGLLSDIASQLD